MSIFSISTFLNKKGDKIQKILNPKKEAEDMKKMIIFSGCFILVLASIVFVSYAKVQKIALSKGNLADLKGKWVGSRTVATGAGINTDLEIFNNSLPLQCKFILYNWTSIQGAGMTKTLDRDVEGRINDQGNLFVKGADVEVELSLYDDGGKKKLEGNYFWAGTKGTMSFKKR